MWFLVMASGSWTPEQARQSMNIQDFVSDFVSTNVASVPGRFLAFVESLARFPENISSLRSERKVVVINPVLFPDADLSSFPKIFAFLPKGLFVAFLAPLPWEAFGAHGVAGVLKSLSLVELLLICLLIPFGVRGGWTLLRSKNALAWLLLIYMAIGYIVLALVLVNLGNLFRLRVPFFVVMLLLASAGGLFESVRQFGVRLGGLWRHRAQTGPPLAKPAPVDIPREPATSARVEGLRSTSERDVSTSHGATARWRRRDLAGRRAGDQVSHASGRRHISHGWR